QSYGYKVMVVDHLSVSGQKICSSSSIRKCVESGDIQSANLLLGRCHAISGQVMRGRARGRTIGFPTLNLSLEHTIMPCRGVYDARVRIGQEWFSGIANIGARPTFSEDELPVLEMHIFDFDADIYGREVTVELLDFIRPEQKFQSIEQLVEQIKRDIAIVKCKKH
ncbi:MAG: riboflavin kinase, partial [Anaplasma sp.]|nr:riboflavin kinase [Anaplasma sp.]